MTRRKANYCPDCGAALESRSVDGRDRQFCPDCREFVFQSPVPTGQVVVLDGRDVLLVERDHGRDAGKWIVPGGFVEVEESAREGAARELEEEAGLAVDPGDLHLVRTGFYTEDPDEGSLLSVCFAVERERTRGTVRVGEEPAAARFWALRELQAGEARTRSVDRRRIEAAFDRLRGRELSLTGE